MDRLSPRDLALLASEDPAAPRHVGTLQVLTGTALTYDALVRLVDERLSFAPRHRQRLRRVPGRLGTPVWVDDSTFDVTHHVRRVAVPRPGGDDELRDLVGRIMSRPLDTARPLWEMYLVEGLADDRVAVLSKSHLALVDGVQTVALGQMLLDDISTPVWLDHEPWQPRPMPGPLAIAGDTVMANLTRPGVLAANTRAAAGAVGRAASALRPSKMLLDSPIAGHLSAQRLFHTVRTDLADHRRVREAHQVSVNDVVLAALTGALRSWMTARGTPTAQMRQLRALVPMSVIDNDLQPTSLGTQITGHLVTLPIGEASPVVRLHQVAYANLAHKETGRAVAASRLTGIAGFAPATFHALGARLAAEQGRGFQLSVTNVPGPQSSLYAAGSRMEECYPVQPLPPGQTLAVGVTSYDGEVFYGITADRDAVPDVDLLGQCLVESLEELVETTRGTRMRAPRGRKRPAPRSPS